MEGTRTKNWLKMKNLVDDDFVACGYIHNESNMSNLVLGQYRDGALVYQGYMTLGVGGKPFAGNHELPSGGDAPGRGSKRPW